MPAWNRASVSTLHFQEQLVVGLRVFRDSRIADTLKALGTRIRRCLRQRSRSTVANATRCQESASYVQGAMSLFGNLRAYRADENFANFDSKDGQCC